jgi:D-arabinose 1-dehydrogenase-like Zn-dependent alcohol dehydrogenase
LKAVVAQCPGGVDVLDRVDLPDPMPGERDLLVRVSATGVCGHDVLSRRGAFPRLRFPAVLGHEIAGCVVAVGADVTEFAVGDRIVSTQNQACGRCADCRAEADNRCRRGRGILGHHCDGVTADFVVVSERSAVLLPANVDDAEGAVLACAVGTALHALRRGRVAAGESVLVTGAGGGVGIHALPLIRHLGAHSIAWARRETADVLQANGAEEVLTGDLDASRVIDATRGRGVDVVLEIVGAASFDRSLRCLRPGGRLVLVGNADAATIQMRAARAILGEVEIVASLGCTRAELSEVVDLVTTGTVTPRIAKRFSSDEWRQAHAAVERGGNLGRVVVECGQSSTPPTDPWHTMNGGIG